MINHETQIKFLDLIKELNDIESMTFVQSLLNITKQGIPSLPVTSTFSKGFYGFKVGQEVYFNARSRGIIFGVITKINRATSKVKDIEGRPWKVSNTLLRLKEAE